jgi:hypothetical protein
VRLRAAQSLYAFRPQQAPFEQSPEHAQHPSRGVFGITQLVERAAELKVFSQSGGMTESAEQDLVARLKAEQAREQVDAAVEKRHPTLPQAKRAATNPGDSKLRSNRKSGAPGEAA